MQNCFGMGKVTRGRRGIASRQCRASPYPLPSDAQPQGIPQSICPKINSKGWKEAKCSVCMECPHNAVLLLCSSHDKGCHPYMCGTSFRYSNCLDQYKKAYSKVAFPDDCPAHESLDDPVMGGVPSVMCIENYDAVELACPLCRGQVKGWTVVEPTREYFNAKKRNCMQDNCSFIGTFKELRKHMRAQHPSAKPREVDPTLEKKWNRMEREREREDVISTIRSSMPGAVFFGDYVIEGSHYGSLSDDEDFDAESMDRTEGFDAGVDRNFMSLFLFLQAFGSAGNAGRIRGTRLRERDSNHTTNRSVRRVSREPTLDTFDSFDQDGDNIGESEDDSNHVPHSARLRDQHGHLLGRSERRRRRRGSDGDMR